MPILNYTTTISTAKTAGEIQEILAKSGAKRVMIEYGLDHLPEAISFQIDIENNSLSYRLPSQWKGVYKALANSAVTRSLKTEEQAKRVSWRIIKDWTEAQLAIIEAGQAEIAEVFMPYMIDPKTNLTLFEKMKSTWLLGSGQ